MKAVLLLTLAFACVFAVRTEKEYQAAWSLFKHKHAKSYSTLEEVSRFEIFRMNVDFIDAHNSNADKTFTVAINKFADLTNQEFSAQFGLMAPRNRTDAKGFEGIFEPKNVGALPTSWNWATKGAVTPIKDQGQCGSCWSFSTTGSVEGCTFLATQKLIGLSEQNLVDCSQAQGNAGCDGGLMDDAFQYIITNKGIDTEASYQYTAQDGNCQYNAANCGARISGFKDVTSGSEAALQVAVYAAPVSIAIDASQSSFQFYSSGVYNEPACSSSQLDHGVLAVGWGVDGTKPYWVVKNSWGTGWGQSGYIWMSRNKSNQCGVATMASFPTGCSTC